LSLLILQTVLHSHCITISHKQFYTVTVFKPTFNIGINGWTPQNRHMDNKDFLTSVGGLNPIKKLKKMDIPLPPKPSNLPIQKPTETNIAMTKDDIEIDIKNQLNDKSIFPEEIPIKSEIGKLGLMWPRSYAEFHKATPLLMSYAQEGCPVHCGPDWSKEKILLLLRRGPHRSSKKKQAIRQLRRETEDKIKHGYARVIKWKNIKNNIPPKLKISPVAMIPHKSKAYRCILDLSFQLHENGHTYKSVNQTTNKKSKPEAMTQLGLCVKRIIAIMADNHCTTRPFYFVKLDIKDGFWRMAVSNDDAWNFAYVLPSLTPIASEDDIELVVPNSLQMGWCESPPFFCSGSETARDVITKLYGDNDLPAHRIENDMLAEIMHTTTIETANDFVTNFEVFVDDFVGYTNNGSFEHLTKVSRAMIHGIHSIFPPPEISKHNGEDPISESKIEKGEGIWSTEKEVLGWIFDGVAYTMRLPEKKIKDIILQIRKILQKKRPSLNRYQRLAGKLQHASYGLPGGRGFFSPIQMAMVGDPDFINLTPELKECLKDWQIVIRHMEKNPTSVLQLVSDYPSYIGYSDSCGIGTGGTWSSGIESLPPFLWKYEWPDDIKKDLVTDNNPEGKISMNDLELAGMVLNLFALECNVPSLYHKHIATFCDNTSAVAWTQRLRTSKSKVAARLLRVISIRLHKRQASSLLPMNIAGEDNTMADVVSRSFKGGEYFSASTNIVDYFNTHFPLTQNNSWREFQIPPKLISLVISSLRGEQLPMGWFLRPPKIDKSTGCTGAPIARSSKCIPSSMASLPSPVTSLSAPSLQGSGEALSAEAIKSRFKESRMRSRPLARPSCWLDNQVQYTALKKYITSTSNAWSKE
jgi:hypothetical protein